jgi:predicted aminopeptidase
MDRPGLLRVTMLGLSLVVTSGCSPAYMIQATSGQLEILRARRPFDQVRADPGTDTALRRKLDLADDAVRFAHDTLGLPDNGSYRQYAELRRPYAVWNVFAAPEFSLELRTWCFPVAGCVAYRGYFAEQAAVEYGARLAQRGYDVYVGGATGYSTLGFFRDPLLSSETRLSDMAMAGVIFHELAHQQLYVPGDTVFSESFATLVEQEGVIAWLQARGDAEGLCDYLRGLVRRREVHDLIRQARDRLRRIYAGQLPDAARRAAKAAEIARLREHYRQLRAHWGRPPYFDGWFDGEINNAALGAFTAYDQHVGTLRVILDGEKGDLRAFYRRAARLARLRPADRLAVMREITSPTLRAPDATCAAGPG